jgi:hypothetical protein
MKKIYLQLYLHGLFGIVVRFFKCLSENGLSYTIKQLFKPINKETEKSVLSMELKPRSPLIERGEPRPSGLCKYPLNSLDAILEHRFKSQHLKGIFIQSPIIDWEVPLFQRPQHMAISMAKLGYLVFYITSNTYDNVTGFTEVYPNLFVTSDLDLCFKLENAVVSIYSTSSYYTPAKLKLIRKNNKIVYEYVDHIDPKISGNATKKLTDQYNYINDKTVDFVACSSKRLLNDFEKKINSARMAYVPNGVEFEHFESALAFSDLVPMPPELYKITSSNRPVVGYYGALAPWLWYDMLKETMELLPDFDFVFIGPDYYGGAQKLPKLANCHYLGSVDYKVLPIYAASFHVAIIPFTPGPIAESTSPLKLFEYFALRKPVVVTADMIECIAFKEVFSASNAKEFAEKIQEAYRLGKDDKFTKRLKEIALENTWDKRAQTMNNMIISVKEH